MNGKDFTFEYLGTRGISRETFEHYGVLTKCNSDGKPIELGFTYPSGGIKIRSLADKDFRWLKPNGPELFGLDKFAAGAHKSIIITEGELDACSYFQCTRVPSVSIRSASSASSDCSAVRQQLNSYERIYLAFDGDAPGRDATASVAKLFEHGKVYDIRFTNRKDANEYLEHGEGDDLLNLFHNAKPYVPDSIVYTFADFKKVLSQKPKEGVPYPFPTLTRMTYGIRTGETVLLKAPEKVGKTSLMHEFERNILKRTDDNVAAIYVEEPRHRHLQALAGLELGRPIHLPDTPSTVDEVNSALQRLCKKDERLHLYNHFGINDPDHLLDTVRFLVAGRLCRYVLFDHISIVCSGLLGDDERRALEYLATKLEMMVKELDFALIMVSHVNDNGQTRGSHYLTKLADITISAQRDTMASDDKVRRTINLSIPYNRFCSNTGDAGSVVFNPVTYRLTEEGADLWQPTISSSHVEEMALAG